MKKVLFIIAAAAVAASVVSCDPEEQKKKDPAGGVDVAKEALVAYFPFDETAADKVSKMEPKTATVEYVAGRRGKCIQGKENAYILYELPADSPLKSMKAISVSMWLKQAPIPAEEAPVPLFMELGRAEDLFWGNFAISIDRIGTKEEPSDKLGIKTATRIPWEGGYGNLWKTDGSGEYNITANRWNHIIFVYDNITSEYHVFLNGVDTTPERDFTINFRFCGYLCGDFQARLRRVASQDPEQRQRRVDGLVQGPDGRGPYLQPRSLRRRSQGSLRC